VLFGAKGLIWRCENKYGRDVVTSAADAVAAATGGRRNRLFYKAVRVGRGELTGLGVRVASAIFGVRDAFSPRCSLHLSEIGAGGQRILYPPISASGLALGSLQPARS
jgi:hypothetical protein